MSKGRLHLHKNNKSLQAYPPIDPCFFFFVPFLLAVSLGGLVPEGAALWLDG